MNLIRNLSKAYDGNSIEVRQRIINSIFPAKLIFNGKKYRTPCLNEVLNLLFSKVNGFGEVKKENVTISDNISYRLALISTQPSIMIRLKEI
jgi:hypothetical protein